MEGVFIWLVLKGGAAGDHFGDRGSDGSTGACPPNTHAEGMLLRQQNILTAPAAFSPLH